MESFLHNQIGFLDPRDNYYTIIVYIHYVFLSFFSI
jgi:hypothetical protein